MRASFIKKGMETQPRQVRQRKRGPTKESRVLIRPIGVSVPTHHGAKSGKRDTRGRGRSEKGEQARGGSGRNCTKDILSEHVTRDAPTMTRNTWEHMTEGGGDRGPSGARVLDKGPKVNYHEREQMGLSKRDSRKTGRKKEIRNV